MTKAFHWQLERKGDILGTGADDGPDRRCLPCWGPEATQQDGEKDAIKGGETAREICPPNRVRRHKRLSQ